MTSLYRQFSLSIRYLRSSVRLTFDCPWYHAISMSGFVDTVHNVKRQTLKRQLALKGRRLSGLRLSVAHRRPSSNPVIATISSSSSFILLNIKNVNKNIYSNRQTQSKTTRLMRAFIAALIIGLQHVVIMTLQTILCSKKTKNTLKYALKTLKNLEKSTRWIDCLKSTLVGNEFQIGYLQHVHRKVWLKATAMMVFVSTNCKSSSSSSSLSSREKKITTFSCVNENIWNKECFTLWPI